MTTTRTHIEIDGLLFETRSDGKVYDPCGRCGSGHGNISYYRHVHGGVCFECLGNGGTWMTVAEMTATVAARRANEERLAANRAKRAAAAERKAHRFAAGNPALVRLLAMDCGADANGSLLSIRGDLLRKGTLTDRQVAAVASLFEDDDNRAVREAELAAKRAAEKAAERPAPTGRVEVTGEIVYTDARDGYAYGTTSYVMIVKADEGYKVWATIPSALFDAEGGQDIGSLRGRRVTMTITLTPKDSDPAFAFGKRPAKASLLAA